jgi:AraC-like DNA-binding protein
MPIFMDRHDSPGITEIEAAEAHKRDIKIQHKYRCNAFTYWFDAERGNVFCLIEAPNEKAVVMWHNEAHGDIPNQIIKVNFNIVETFLGRIKDPEARDETELLKLIGPAFRVVMVTDFKNIPLLKSKLGNNESVELLRLCNHSIEKAIDQCEGREVEYSGNSIMASFVSTSKAVKCALDIQNHFMEQNCQNSWRQMDVAIGLSAGNPVTDKVEFFGDAISFAKRLAYIASKGQILMSSVVRDHYKEEQLQIFPKDITIRALNPMDDKFLDRLMNITEKAWNQPGFKVSDFNSQMGLSKSQLYRHTTALTGFSPSEFLKEYKLKKALELIERQQDNIAQIALETGFNNPSYFSKCFYNRFGILPRDFAQSIV